MKLTKLTMYHGGHMSDNGRIWVTDDREYAAGYAEMNGGSVHDLDVEIDNSDILDLTHCHDDAIAAANALAEIGIEVGALAEEEPHCVLARVTDEQILAAGYKAVRIEEWTEFVGECTSLCIVDRDVIS